MTTGNPPKYKRILLKMSGEALMGDQAFGLDAKVVRRIAGEIRQLAEAGVEVAIVVGGGNLFRGAQLASFAARNWRRSAWSASPATTWEC